jgi:hypothetical protein
MVDAFSWLMHFHGWCIFMVGAFSNLPHSWCIFKVGAFSNLPHFKTCEERRHAL